MDNFARFIDRVLSHEGGYVHDPRDPGGETKFGISKRAYPTLDIAALTRDDAIAIYRRDYWEPIAGDRLPPAVAFQVLDAAVNHGVGTAIRFLQRAAGVADDGTLGPVTLAAVAAAYPATLAVAVVAARLDFYTRLARFPDFGRGWVRRAAQNLAFISTDCASA